MTKRAPLIDADGESKPRVRAGRRPLSEWKNYLRQGDDPGRGGGDSI